MIASDNRLLFDDIARYHLFFLSSQQLKNLIQLVFTSLFKKNTNFDLLGLKIPFGKFAYSRFICHFNLCKSLLHKYKIIQNISQNESSFFSFKVSPKSSISKMCARSFPLGEFGACSTRQSFPSKVLKIIPCPPCLSNRGSGC